jgi:hypothetical protein
LEAGSQKTEVSFFWLRSSDFWLPSSKKSYILFPAKANLTSGTKRANTGHYQYFGWGITQEDEPSQYHFRSDTEPGNMPLLHLPSPMEQGKLSLLHGQGDTQQYKLTFLHFRGDTE